MKLVKNNEATASKRRVYFDIRLASDGITIDASQNGQQPQISIDGAAFTNTGIGVLSYISNGRYYADLTQAVCVTGRHIETRFQAGTSAETPGDSVVIVSHDPYTDITTLLSLIGDLGTDVEGVASDVATLDGKVDTIDGIVDAIVEDTNEIQGKLPDNNIMGSSVKTDKDDEIDNINSSIGGTLNANVTQVTGQSTIDGQTLNAAISYVLAVLAGKVSGAEDNAPVFRSVNDSSDRVSATTDAHGNRTSVTLTPP